MKFYDRDFGKTEVDHYYFKVIFEISNVKTIKQCILL